jgi:hypothetical protein
MILYNVQTQVRAYGINRTDFSFPPISSFHALSLKAFESLFPLEMHNEKENLNLSHHISSNMNLEARYVHVTPSIVICDLTVVVLSCRRVKLLKFGILFGVLPGSGLCYKSYDDMAKNI